MKIHSDTLIIDDLYDNLPPLVWLDCIPVGSRKRDHGFVVSLSYRGQGGKGTGRRRKNSGWAGGDSGNLAATWDEWGVWMAALYNIDPDAIIGNYRYREDFYAQTSRYQPRGARAPWLTGHRCPNDCDARCITLGCPA